MTETLSEGALRLAAVGSISETARLLGCAARTVSAYRSGERIPGPRMRARIERHPEISVPAAAWFRAPSPATSSAPEAGTPSVLVQALREQHSRLTAALTSGNLTPRARGQLESLALRTLRELARLERRRSTKPHTATLARVASRMFLERADAIDAERAAQLASETSCAASVAAPLPESTR